MKRFENKNDGKIYEKIETWLNMFFLSTKSPISDTLVTFSFPNGSVESCLFIDEENCGWLHCYDDYIESEPYINVLGFRPIDSISIVDNRVYATNFEHENDYLEYINN
jgi:hypothetical protein